MSFIIIVAFNSPASCGLRWLGRTYGNACFEEEYWYLALSFTLRSVERVIPVEFWDVE